MRLFLLGALLWLTLGRPAPAEEVFLRVEPGGAQLMDLGSGRVFAPSDGAGATFRFDTDTAAAHVFRLTRPPFDTLDFTLAWSPEVGRWHIVQGAEAHFLRPGDTLYLSRTIHLNVRPSDGVSAYIDAPGGDQPTRVEQTLTVAGVVHPIMPLSLSAAGYVVPHAWQPPPVYVARPGFDPLAIHFEAGDLAREGDLFPLVPVDLKPSYGPFSYRTFNTILGLGIGAVLAWAGLLWLPRRRRQQQARVRRLQLDRAVEDSRETVRGISLDGLVEQTVTTEQGEPFLVLRPVGEGGMGAVFEVMPGQGSQRPVDERWAIKVLLGSEWDEPSFRARFIREVTICSRLQHPGIVKVLDWGLIPLRGASNNQVQQHPFMVMELLQGSPLDRLLQERRIIEPSQAVVWATSGLKALAAAHRAGIIHRDLKPSNILVTSMQNVKLMDFGIARDTTAPGITTTQGALGTPGYMSPEHFDDAQKVTPVSDIYSLGIVFYQMLTGRLPYEFTSVWDLLGRMMTEPPPPVRTINPYLSEGLAAIVMRMIEKEPAARFQSATDVLNALAEMRDAG